MAGTAPDLAGGPELERIFSAQLNRDRGAGAARGRAARAPRRLPSRNQGRGGGAGRQGVHAVRALAAGHEGQAPLPRPLPRGPRGLAGAHALEAQPSSCSSAGRRSAACRSSRSCTRGTWSTRATAAPRGGAPERARLLAQPAPGRRHAPRCAQLGRLLPSPARHPRQARRVRLRLRASGGRGVRAAPARRAPRAGRGTARAAEAIVVEENPMAGSLQALFPKALDASLPA